MNVAVLTCKILQRRLYTATSTKSGSLLVYVRRCGGVWRRFPHCLPARRVLTLALTAAVAMRAVVDMTTLVAAGAPGTCGGAGSDNLGGKAMVAALCGEPIDVVYTWVNGSDPVWLEDMQRWREADLGLSPPTPGEPMGNGSNGQDPAGSNRFRDNEELRYSLRSLYKYAPWVRRVYLVTNGQVPSWLNLAHPRITVVPHSAIFADPEALPVFSSPAIEVNLHRIPGLSRRFVYFNDDVLLGAPVLPEDFVSPAAGQRVYLDWDVPRCGPGCVESWIGDGFCDTACNTTTCLWDAGDCANGTDRSRHSPTVSEDTPAPCVAGCPHSWIADKMCDARCDVRACGFDAGDCGLQRVTDAFPTAASGAELQGAADANAHPAWAALQRLVAAVPTDAQADMDDERALDWPAAEVLTVSVDSPTLAVEAGEEGGTHPVCRALTSRCTSDAECRRAGWSAAHAMGLWHGAERSARVSVAVAGGAPLPLPVTRFPVLGTDTAVLADEAVVVDVSRPLDAARALAVAQVAAALAAHYAWQGLHAGDGAAEAGPSCADAAVAALSTCQVAATQPEGVSATQRTQLEELVQRCGRVQGSLTLTGQDAAWVAKHVTLSVTEAERGAAPFLRRAAALALHRKLVLVLDTGRLSSASAVWGARMRMAPAAVQEAAAALAAAQGRQRRLLPAPQSVADASEQAASSVDHSADSAAVEAPPLPAQLPAGAWDVLQPVTVATVPFWLRLQAGYSGGPLLRSHTLQCRGSAAFPSARCSALLRPVSLDRLLELPLRVNVTSSVLQEAAAEPPASTPATEVAPEPEAAPVTAAPVSTARRLAAHRQQVPAWATERRQSMPAQREGDALPRRLEEVGVRPAAPGSPAGHAAQAARVAAHGGVDLARLVRSAWAAVAARPQAPPRRRGRRLLDLYGQSLVFSNRLVTGAFGHSTRRVPAHMPHMIDVGVMQQVVAAFPDAIAATQRHRFRHGADVQFAFLYFHFLMEGGAAQGVDMQAYWQAELDSDGSGALEWNELRTLAAVVAGGVPTTGDTRTLLQCLLPGYPLPASVDVRSVAVELPVVTLRAVMACQLAVDGLRAHVRFPPSHTLGSKEEVGFEMVVDDYNVTLDKLDALRARKPKFLCVNDDMRLAPQAVRAVVDGFFRSIVPRPCPLELPAGQVNAPYLPEALARVQQARWEVALWNGTLVLLLCAAALALLRRCK